MNKLLSQKLPNEEKENLSLDGFSFSRPTRATCILVALFRKAAGGDMSAIKEVLSLVSDEKTNEKGEVTIIDNVPHTDN